MPRDSVGTYSLPVGYLAVTGERVLASQHNPPLEDLAAAMTTSLPRTGVAPMTGQLRAASGTVLAPGVAFASGTNSGIYLKSDGGLGLSSAGLDLGTVPIGAGMDFWGTTAPTGWLFPYGQAVSRTTYAALFAVLGTNYGAGDGSTTFNLPDKRDRASFGKGNMGGTSAGRITNQSGGWAGDTLGAAGGSETQALTQANLPSATLTTSISDTRTWKLQNVQSSSIGLGGTGGNINVLRVFPGGNDSNDVTVVSGSISASTSLGGSGTAHNNLPPGIVCNYIIFAGV